MMRKLCEHCNKYSYSADTSNKWYCAYCNNDLSSQPMLKIESINKTDGDSGTNSGSDS